MTSGVLVDEFSKHRPAYGRPRCGTKQSKCGLRPHLLVHLHICSRGVGPVTGVRPVGTLQKFLKKVNLSNECKSLRLRLGSLYTGQLLNSLMGFVVNIVFIAMMSLINNLPLVPYQHSVLLQLDIQLPFYWRLHFSGKSVAQMGCED